MKIDDGSWSLTASEAGSVQQRPEAFGTRGMVCSAHPVAAFIGLTILQRGGNAFDAAIAVAAAEGVVLPMKCGLGGDAFVILHDAKKRETVAYNGSGVAAAGADHADAEEIDTVAVLLGGIPAPRGVEIVAPGHVISGF